MTLDLPFLYMANGMYKWVFKTHYNVCKKVIHVRGEEIERKIEREAVCGLARRDRKQTLKCFVGF